MFLNDQETATDLHYYHEAIRTQDRISLTCVERLRIWRPEIVYRIHTVLTPA